LYIKVHNYFNMDGLPQLSSTHKQVLLLGFGSVGQHVVQLLLARSPCRPRPDLCIKAISDSSGGLHCPTGLPLAAVLRWKQAGNKLQTFTSNDYIIVHYVDTLHMVQSTALSGDIVLDATPVNLTDGGVGLACCRYAAEKGIHIVMANKAPLVLCYQQLMHSARQAPISSIEFSGAVCGGLPVINVGRRDLTCCAQLNLVQGIFNSTSNYILSRMAAGEAPDIALANAREVGIAEADASLDLEGFDTANKLVIICNAVLNIPVTLRDVEREGMMHITQAEVEAAGKEGMVYRLIATAERRFTAGVSCDDHHETTEDSIDAMEEDKRGEEGAGDIANDVEKEEAKRKQQCANFKLSVCPTLVLTTSFFGQCTDTDMSVVFVSDEFETISLKTNEKGVFPTAAAVLRDCCTIIKNTEN
jgi:homoserine dehydrogenase